MPGEEFRLRHRRRVLEFVASREVPLLSLLEGSFDTGGRHTRWERLEANWNRANPKDPLKWETLKRYYFRARRDERVREAYLANLRRLWGEWAERVTRTQEMLASGGRGIENVFVQFSEPRPVSPEESEIFGWPPGKKMSGVEFRAKYPPKVGAALAKAWKAKCVLPATSLAFPKDTEFCRRRDCRGCRIYRALKHAAILEVESAVLQDPRRLAELRAELERRFREKFWLTLPEKVAPAPGARSPDAKRTTPSRRSRSSAKS